MRECKGEWKEYMGSLMERAMEAFPVLRSFMEGPLCLLDFEI